MIDVAAGVICCIFLLTIIGIGPALIIFINKLDIAIAVAPTIAIAITTIIGSYLIILNLPILTWGYGWLIIGSILSLITAIYIIKKSNQRLDINYKEIGFLLFGLITISIIILLPMILGGLSFTVLRGNGSDTFNYMMMAGYLQHEPFSYAQSADIQKLINKHSSYTAAKALLTERWSTSMLLGWLSLIVKIPLYKFEYGFTSLFFILAYGCTYCLSKLMGLTKPYIILVSIAVCAGFWAQFVMDIRAFSHISVIPIVLFFTILVIEIEKLESEWIYILFLSFIFTTIALLYVEILSLVALGLSFYFILQCTNKQLSILKLFKLYLLATISTAIILLPFAKIHLINFFYNQIHFAITHKVTWDQAYFKWLYENPLLGFWGLLLPNKMNISETANIGINISAIILTFILIYITLNTLRKKENNIEKIFIALTLTSWLEFLYLYFCQQYWAAGKVISFNYSSLLLLIVYAGIITLQCSSLPKLLKYTGKYVIIIFLIIQCSFAIFRIVNANKKEIYFPQEISAHGSYKKHDWNIDAIRKTLTAYNIDYLGLAIPDISVSRFLEYAFGWDLKLVNLVNISNDKAINQQSINLPKYIILNSKYLKETSFKQLQKNNEFVLVKVNSDSDIEHILFLLEL